MSTIYTSKALPDYVEGAARKAVGMASQLADRPYQKYTGPRVAGFTPDQTAAFERVRSQVGAYAPQIQQASQMAQRAGTATLADADLSGYMNPFTQSVIDRSIENIQRAGQIARNNINARATRAGAYGGSRHGVVEAMQREAETRAIGDTVANLNLLNFAQAVQNWQADQQRAIPAASLMGQLATTGQAIDLRDIASLLDIGGQQQALNQNNLNVAYQDFLEERGWPVANLDILTRALHGTPSGSTTIESGGSNTAANIGAFASLVGAASQLPGLIKGVGSFLGW